MSKNLYEILEAFNAPIKFDQAWAVVYVYLNQAQRNDSWNLPNRLNDIHIYKDGKMEIREGSEKEKGLTLSELFFECSTVRHLDVFVQHLKQSYFPNWISEKV